MANDAIRNLNAVTDGVGTMVYLLIVGDCNTLSDGNGRWVMRYFDIYKTDGDQYFIINHINILSAI